MPSVAYHIEEQNSIRTFKRLYSLNTTESEPMVEPEFNDIKLNI